MSSKSKTTRIVLLVVPLSLLIPVAILSTFGNITFVGDSPGVIFPGLPLFCGAALIVIGLFLKKRRRPLVTAGLSCLAGPMLLLLISPMFLCYRNDSRRGLCINNLRLIDHAKEVLSHKNGWTNGYVIAPSPDEIWKVLDVYVDGTNRLRCPKLRSSVHYNYNLIGVTPTCSYGKEHVYVPAGE